MNDGICEEECSVVYTSFIRAVGWVKKFGKGALLAKNGCGGSLSFVASASR